jgi:hypothetical protein
MRYVILNVGCLEPGETSESAQDVLCSIIDQMFLLFGDDASIAPLDLVLPRRFTGDRLDVMLPCSL